MNKNVFFQALTPLHIGVGRSADSIVDLPVAREAATGWPQVPASALKGVLRDLHPANADDLFGTPDKAGTINLTDLRVLCLPVASYFGTMAYVTCPLVLQFWRRDAAAFGLSSFAGSIPQVSGSDVALAPESVLIDGGSVYLLDLDLHMVPPQQENASVIANSIADALFPSDEEANLFKQRFAVVSNEAFNFFCLTALPINARVQLQDDTKTVKTGALWYEETCAPETIFWHIATVADFATRSAQAAQVWEQFSCPIQPIQIGGNAGIGQGWGRLTVKG
jgi:CRISPR-associated protein Cmr4